MTNHNPQKSIRQAVLEKIQSGGVRKLPHAYFVFRIAVTIFVSLLLLLVSGFFISFMLFSFHESGEEFLLGFGVQGIVTFLMLFPWLLFLLDIVLLFLLETLLQGFKFGYRVPLLNIFLVIFATSVLFGILLNATPVQSFLLQQADKNELPIVGDAYEHIFDHHDNQGVYRGIVSDVHKGGFTMQHNDQDHDSDDGQFNVTAIPGNSIPPVKIGDRVLIFGVQDKNGIQARNVQILPPVYPH